LGFGVKVSINYLYASSLSVQKYSGSDFILFDSRTIYFNTDLNKTIFDVYVPRHGVLVIGIISEMIVTQTLFGVFSKTI